MIKLLFPLVQCAVGDLKDEIQVQSKSSVATPALNLLPTASEMVTRMETIQHLLQLVITRMINITNSSTCHVQIAQLLNFPVVVIIVVTPCD